MPYRWKTWPGLLLAAVLATGLLLPADARAEDPFEPVRQRIQKAIAESNLASLSVAVVQRGEIVWEQGFGLADRENHTPASEHTTYSVASVSKPITATALMVLLERGLVDLDQPLDNYLGDAKLRARVGNSADATVRRVANHTAGLPLHYQFFYDDESFSPPSYDETILRYGNLVTIPGERYQYSNLGYGLLDYVIERVSGKSYATFCREEVFLPLGMTHTSIDIAPGLESHQAIRYTPEGKRIPFYRFDHAGASAVYSSAHDLARFAMFHLKEHLPYQRAILSDASLDAMHRPTSSDSDSQGYGIGWSMFTDDRGYGCIQHTGGMPGVSTCVLMIPEERVAVIALANGRSPLAYRLPKMISSILLPAKKLPNPSNEAEQGGDVPDSDSLTLPAELSGTWQGEIVTYQGHSPFRMDVKESGEVQVELSDQASMRLTQVSYRDGFLRGRFAGVLPYEDNRGRDYLIHLELKLRGEELNGSATTHTQSDNWGSNAVTHWAELHRQ